MDKDCIIVIDTGTTSIRALLFDDRGRALAVSQVDNPPTYFEDGRVEQDPSTWSDSLVVILREIAGRAAAEERGIACVALASQRSSVIPVDGNGLPLHPAIMWQDTRTAQLSREMAPQSGAVYARSGLPISPVFSAIKMRWLRENRPDLLRRTAKMLGVQDFLIYTLTGKFVTDRSLGSRTNLLDLESGEWDEELLRLFGVERRLLCDLVDPGAVAGAVGARAAAATGLPAGLPVVSAGGDQQCAALGMGLLGESDLVANTGTGAYIIGLSSRPIHDPERRLFCNISALPGRYVAEAAIPAAGVVYRWFSDRFYAPSGAADRFAEINTEVEASPPGANGVILLPYFKGAGAPRWDPAAKGMFWGLGLSTARGDMARAVLEGIAAEMADDLELVEEFAGKKERIFAAGGLTRFPEFGRILAGMFGRTVTGASESEATARGAWISAAVRAGLYPDHAAAFAAATAAAATAAAGAEEPSYPADPERGAVYLNLRKKRERLYRAVAAAGL